MRRRQASFTSQKGSQAWARGSISLRCNRWWARFIRRRSLFGGCCGSDLRHLTEIAQSPAPRDSGILPCFLGAVGECHGCSSTDVVEQGQLRDFRCGTGRLRAPHRQFAGGARLGLFVGWRTSQGNEWRHPTSGTLRLALGRNGATLATSRRLEQGRPVLNHL